MPEQERPEKSEQEKKLLIEKINNLQKEYNTLLAKKERTPEEEKRMEKIQEEIEKIEGQLYSSS